MTNYEVIKTKKIIVNLSHITSKEDVMKTFSEGLFKHFGGDIKTWHLDAFKDYFYWYQP